MENIRSLTKNGYLGYFGNIIQVLVLIIHNFIEANA